MKVQISTITFKSEVLLSKAPYLAGSHGVHAVLYPSTYCLYVVTQFVLCTYA